MIVESRRVQRRQFLHLFRNTVQSNLAAASTVHTPIVDWMSAMATVLINHCVKVYRIFAIRKATTDDFVCEFEWARCRATLMLAN